MNQPTFSVVLESANLSVAELENLQNTLSSLAADQWILLAKEVLLMDSGDVPPEMMQQVLAQYPWLRAIAMPAGVGYEDLKMAGASLATGEIIVIADGDCFYEKGWLQNLLAPFSDPAVDVVGGHTEINSATAYGLGVKIAFSFAAADPENSGSYRTDRYHLNNVAFRKSVLQRVPIPSRLSCYRMTGIHAARLKAAGCSIIRQPSARAVHAPPNGFVHFVWRFLLFGHDAVIVPRLIAQDHQSAHSPDSSRTLRRMAPRWIKQCFTKFSQELRQKPRRLLDMPVSFIVFGVAISLQFAGALGGLLFSKQLLQAMPDDIRRASTTRA